MIADRPHKVLDGVSLVRHTKDMEDTMIEKLRQAVAQAGQELNQAQAEHLVCVAGLPSYQAVRRAAARFAQAKKERDAAEAAHLAEQAK